MNKNRKKNTVTESAAEAKLKGFLDMIVERKDLKKVFSDLLRMHGGKL